MKPRKRWWKFWNSTKAPEIRAAYDGAAIGRRTDGWLTTGADGNSEVAVGIVNLRERSRDLCRNNPHAAKGIRALVDNIVGEGILPRSQTGDAALDAKVDALFARWSPWIDVDGELTYNGLVYRAVRAFAESGDVFARRRIREPRDGLPVPLQIQMLEADMVPSDLNQVVAGGGRILEGIEFDPIGRRRAYHFYKNHPGSSFVDVAAGASLQYGLTAPVPADSVAHLYDVLTARPGQCRGVPWMSPVIRALRDLDDYSDAERVRKKSESCVVANVEGGDADQAADGADSLAPAITDSSGRSVEYLEPGLITRTRDGKTITFNHPQAVGGYPEYIRTELHAIAAGMQLTYELLSGDLSQVNYSSIRAGLIEFRRMIRIIRSEVVIPLLCQRIYDWFVEAAIISGALPRTQGGKAIEYKCKWSEPRFEEVDRLKEATATASRIRNGLDTLTNALAAEGEDVAHVLTERAKELELADSLRLILDTDPRKTSQSGQTAGQDTNPDLAA